MSDKRTAPVINAMKAKGEKIVCVTAYDWTSARIADLSGADLILVGDSLGNVILGYDTTVPVTLEDMVHHTRAAARAVQRALLIADLPFGSYQASPEQAVKSSVELMKAGAHGVKLEGPYRGAITALARAGIPVMGHVGFTPQSVHAFGGFKVQGRTQPEVIRDAAKVIEEAGAFSIVLELMPAELSREITAELSCPTIGIGAGPECDGQIQVFHDVLGLGEHQFKHAKRYANGLETFRDALEQYGLEVRAGTFPGPEHSF